MDLRSIAFCVAVVFTSPVQAAGVVPGGTLGVNFDSDLETGVLNGTGGAVGGGVCEGGSTSGCDVEVVGVDGFIYGFSFTGEDSFIVALEDPSFSRGPFDLTVSALFSISPGYELTSIVAAPSRDFTDFLFDPVDNPTSPITDPSLPSISFGNDLPADPTEFGQAFLSLEFSGIQDGWWPDGGYFLDFNMTFAPVDGGGGGTPVVPLPASGLLLGLGILGLAALRRRA